MTANPEQHVLDAIDELVDWQLEEGHRRGDGPAVSRNSVLQDMANGCMPILRRIDDQVRTAIRRVSTQVSATIGCYQPGCHWTLPIEWRDPGAAMFGVVDRLEPAEIEERLRNHCESAHGGIPAVRVDSRSAPGIDTINPANGEQPSH